MKKVLVLGLFLAGLIGNAYATGETDGQVVTSKLYVDTELSGKQKSIGSGGQGGSGANGDVVTYTGTAGTVGSKQVYGNTYTYNSQTSNLVEANTVNTAIQNGLNGHLTCAVWSDNTQTDCWKWQIVTQNNAVYLPQGQTARPQQGQ